MQFNTSYLNQTPNKTIRSAPAKLVGVVLHETAGGGSLEWCLRRDVAASFNYLILASGRIHHYVDETVYSAWHAGIKSRWTVNGAVYEGGAFNVSFIGVELEGPNDGTPITTAQHKALIDLMRFLSEKHGIPLQAEYWPEHAAIAPGYKTDALGYTGAAIVREAATIGPAFPPPMQDAVVIGDPPSITVDHFKRCLVRHKAPISVTEAERVFALCGWLGVDAAFLIAVWKHEGGSPFGSSDIQQKSRNPGNIKAASDEWRKTIMHSGMRWHWYESFQLGLFALVLHLKNTYGAAGLRTVREIIAVYAPNTVDGNNTEAYIFSVLTDMHSIKNN